LFSIFICYVAYPVINIALTRQCEQSESNQSQKCSDAPAKRFIVGIGTWFHAYSADVGALSTVMIAIFTVTLWRATSGQLRHLEQQLALSQKDFISANHPKVVLRAAFTSPLKEGRHVFVRCIFSNYGGADAIITKKGLRLVQADRPDGKPLTDDIVGVWDGTDAILAREKRRIAPGEWFYHGPSTDITWDEQLYTPQVIHGGYHTRLYLLLVGVVEYTDDSGVLRHVSVRRVLDPQTERFCRIDGEELDYAD